MALIAQTKPSLKNLWLLFLGSMFLFVSVLLYLSLCAMPCEYAAIDDHLEDEGHSSLVERRVKFLGTRTRSAFLVVLVVTGPKYFERRTTIRETWMSNKPSDVTLLFSVGTLGLSSQELSTLQYEDSQHGDLLLLPELRDDYHNLTTKVLLSFRWIDRNVQSQFVFKVDDDTFAQMDIILDELRQRSTGVGASSSNAAKTGSDGHQTGSGSGASRLYWGFFDGRARVKKRGQWAETAWCLCDTYLPHARGGGYILSSDLVHYLAKNSKYLQKFNSEDISVGAWLAPLEVNRVHDPRFDTEYESRGCVNQYIVTHKQDVQAMRSKYENIKSTGKLCSKEYKKKYSYIYNWNVPPSMCCIRNDSSVP